MGKKWAKSEVMLWHSFMYALFIIFESSETRIQLVLTAGMQLTLAPGALDLKCRTED